MSMDKRILVVDDEPDVVALIEGRLKKEKYQVDVAYNGVEAIKKVEECIPDCIVLDVMMPEKDGYAVCAELKKNPRYEEIPIVMLTAVADHVSSTRYSHYDGMSMEADDYIPKGPDSTEQIVQSIRELLA
ncbi:response regulator [Desulfonema ishimotonii]|uniref:Response regulator n=1 Tax=Desulfonema ishimotonii TaxID=45657 RepID=A0A401G128_9BACT|nr:response regulator [Desulfonema ishimotonii]GBC62911.1 response regulator [Desulfonema ishimotonii]